MRQDLKGPSRNFHLRGLVFEHVFQAPKSDIIMIYLKRGDHLDTITCLHVIIYTYPYI